jgi:hypothetical protein
MNRLFLIICMIMRAEPELMARAPIRDRIACVSEAALLAQVAFISAIAWTTFWAPYVALPIACLFGGIAFFFIGLLDIAIGAADWRPEGILRPPGTRRRWDWWGKIALRIAMTVILSVATSEGATMAMFHQAVMEQLGNSVMQHNHDAQDRFNRQVTALRQQHFGPLLDEINKQTELISQTTNPLDEALQLEAAAENHLAAAKIKADREHYGRDGSAKGDGRLFQAALREQEAAQADLVKATARVGIFQPRVEQAKKQLKTAQDRLAQADTTIRDDVAKLERNKEAELVTLHNDPLLTYRALEQIYANPDTGPAARHFALLMKLVLITLELSYLAVRLWFAHTSVYTMLLIADTRLRADTAHADYERRRAEVLAGAPPPPPRTLPPIRLISWDPPDAKRPDDETHPPPGDRLDDDRDAAD